VEHGDVGAAVREREKLVADRAGDARDAAAAAARHLRRRSSDPSRRRI